jgi:hypothetical protein
MLTWSRLVQRPCDRVANAPHFRLALALLWAPLSLVGCDPQVTLGGHLTSSTGQPVKVGEVRIECPNLCVYAVANDQGDFSGSKLGRGCSLSCRLRVRSVGYRDVDVEAGKYCSKPDGATCSDFLADVTLTPMP